MRALLVHGLGDSHLPSFEVLVDVLGAKPSTVTDHHVGNREPVDVSAGDAKQAGELGDGQERLKCPSGPVSWSAVVLSQVTEIVPPGEPRELGHFEPGGGHYGGTLTARAVEVGMLPVIVLGAVLGNDETFRRLAREVDGDDEQAHRLSARYVRSGAGRRAIAAMLLSASTAPPNALTTRLMNMSRRRAAFIDGPPDEGDARYALRGETLGAFQRRSELIARRGARRCLHCGAERVRNTYCAAHKLEHCQQARDRDAQRVVLRAVAESLGFETDGPTARRLRRSVNSRR